MLKHTTALWLFITVFITTLSGCSDTPLSNLYSHDGFSVSLPENWVFSNDSENSLFGEREIVFSLGEFSFAAFYVHKKDSDFSDFIDFYIQKSQLNGSHPETNIERLNRTIAKHDAIVTTITSDFIGEEEITTLYSVNIPLEKKNVYFMSLIAPEDKVSIDDELEYVIESLEFNY